MKKAKYRQIIYKRLLEDFISDSKHGNTEVLRFCINDLKFKYSLTKIMQIFQLNWNMCNIYMIKNDNLGNISAINFLHLNLALNLLNLKKIRKFNTTIGNIK